MRLNRSDAHRDAIDSVYHVCRANAVLQALVGYRVKEIGDDGDRERVAAFFITQELGAGSGGEAALEAVSGKWDEFSGADGDAPQWQPPPADCLGESSARPQQPMDFDKLLLRPPALRAVRSSRACSPALACTALSWRHSCCSAPPPQLPLVFGRGSVHKLRRA